MTAMTAKPARSSAFPYPKVKQLEMASESKGEP